MRERSTEPDAGGLLENVAHYARPPQSPIHSNLPMARSVRSAAAPSSSDTDNSNYKTAKRLRADALRLQEQHEDQELRDRRRVSC